MFRAVNFIIGAVKWAQWFLKGGYQHPIRAIGMVAAVVILAGATIVRAFPPVEASLGPPPWLNVKMFALNLKLEKLAAVPMPDGLMIECDILNAGETLHKLPRLRVSLLDTAERVLQYEIFDPPVSQLAPGEVAHFKTQIQHPDKAAANILVSFAL